MKNLTDKQIGYLAGILDGEGCLSIRHQNYQRSYYATLQVSNTDFALITALLELTCAGRVSAMPRYGNRKQAYKWIVTVAADVYRIIDAVYPCLLVKRAQADVLYKLREVKSAPLIRHGKQRGTYLLAPETVAKCKLLFAKCAELNFRGFIANGVNSGEIQNGQSRAKPASAGTCDGQA